MGQPAWPRRLDDRVDEMLRRRLGTWLLGGPQPAVGQQVLMAVAGSSTVVVVLLIAMVLSDQAHRAPILIGPVVGVVLGLVLGRVLHECFDVTSDRRDDRVNVYLEDGEVAQARRY